MRLKKSNTSTNIIPVGVGWREFFPISSLGVVGPFGRFNNTSSFKLFGEFGDKFVSRNVFDGDTRTAHVKIGEWEENKVNGSDP